MLDVGQVSTLCLGVVYRVNEIAIAVENGDGIDPRSAIVDFVVTKVVGGLAV